MLEQGNVDGEELKSVLRGSVDDLRAVIDSLEPLDGDLISVLATLRFRLGKRLELAGIAFALLMLLSLYLLPASNREFKDLQFEIRNRFVSSLLQEGAFTTISDKLTIYIHSRDDRGECSPDR